MFDAFQFVLHKPVIDDFWLFQLSLSSLKFLFMISFVLDLPLFFGRFSA